MVIHMKIKISRKYENGLCFSFFSPFVPSYSFTHIRPPKRENSTVWNNDIKWVLQSIGFSFFNLQKHISFFFHFLCYRISESMAFFFSLVGQIIIYHFCLDMETFTWTRTSIIKYECNFHLNSVQLINCITICNW